MLIQDSHGRTDGNSGYSRLLGNQELGNLISRVQSTVISNGNELERLILERCKSVVDLDDFFVKVMSDVIPDGIYVCTKKLFRKSKVYCTDQIKNIEPDLIILSLEKGKNECYIVELKDGDAFDTKKSQGEYENLSRFSLYFGARIPFITNFYICSFNQSNKDIIYNGFKKKFSYEHILTGEELCYMLKIHYREIIDIRKRDAEQNFNYFISELLKIKEVYNRIKQLSSV